ncbi:MAG: SDR family oxidoreductase [Bacillota bacterium]
MILVTGATGHLGNVLVRELLERGERVRAMVLPGESLQSLHGLLVEVIVGNILDRAVLEKAMAGIETVYHLAGIISIMPGSHETMYRVNVDGARNVAETALQAGVRRLVHTASIHAYRREPHGVLIDENTPLAPDSPAGAYDRSKAEGALAVLELAEKGLDAVVVCPTGIIGPHDYLESEMGQLLKSFATRKLHFLVNGAFDFVDVRDVARGLIRAAEKGRTGEAYILSGNCVTLQQLRRLTQEAAGIRSRLVMLPFKTALFVSRFTEQLYRICKTTPQFTCYSLQTVIDNTNFSCAKAARELGYQARPLIETITDSLAWQKQYYQKTFQNDRRKAVRRNRRAGTAVGQ